jgi:Pectate lyase superfamily protein
MAKLRAVVGLLACALLAAITVDCPGVVATSASFMSQDASSQGILPGIGNHRPSPPAPRPPTHIDYGSIINKEIEACGPVKYNAFTQGFTGFGCQIQIPAGVFTIDTPIRLESGVSLVGEGRAATILKLGAGVNKSVIQIGTNKVETGPFSWVNFLSYINIEHLSIDGNATNQTQPTYAIHLASAGFVTVRDVRIANINSHAIVADNGSLVKDEGASLRVGSLRLEDIDIVAAPQPGFISDSYGGAPVGIYLFGAADSWISHVQINGSSAMYADLYIRDCGSMMVSDNTFSGGGQTTSVAVGGNNDHIRIHDNYFDPEAKVLNPSWLPISNVEPYSCVDCNIQQ